MNGKKQKYFNAATTTLQAIVIFVLGLFILKSMDTFLGMAVYIVSFGFMGVGLVQTLKNIFPKTEKVLPIEFIYSAGNIVIGAFILAKPAIFVDLFPLLFTIYVGINSIVKFITYWIYKNNDIKGRMHILLRSLISFIFFLILIFHPLVRDTITYIIVGIYFIMLSITYLFDGIDSMIPKSKKDKLKRRFHLTLPVIIAAFLSKKALDEINEIFATEEEEIPEEVVRIVKEKVEPDIEVFVHMGEKGFATFGHVDVYFEGRIISYGSYDEDHVKLGSAIGDGVLFETGKDKYTAFCNTQADKTLVGFGIVLSDAQKQAIQDKLEELKEPTYPWEPKAQREKNGQYEDYASRLYTQTGAKFWKFKSGKFKTYFVLNTNCVLLADQLMGASGIDIIKISGIVTPGTYYDYLNREFERENSRVVTKNIYLER